MVLLRCPDSRCESEPRKIAAATRWRTTEGKNKLTTVKPLITVGSGVWVGAVLGLESSEKLGLGPAAFQSVGDCNAIRLDGPTSRFDQGLPFL